MRNSARKRLQNRSKKSRLHSLEKGYLEIVAKGSKDDAAKAFRDISSAFDKAAKTGSVEVVIDMKSVDTGVAVFNGHIQGEDFFDTEKFPTATFKSTKVRFEGDKPVSIDGNLTIKGVTKPVTLTVSSFQAMPHPMLKKDAIGANASTKVKRSEFNAGKYAPYVGDEVTIDIALEAIKQ